jgi:hypothetical protein
VDRTSAFAQRDPELVVVRPEAHVVRAEADKHPVENPATGKADHNELTARIVCHIGVPTAGRERGDVR